MLEAPGDIPTAQESSLRHGSRSPLAKSVCTADGYMCFLEIQEGAEPMQKKHIAGYESKASMTLRLCESAKPGMVAIGDADFGGVPHCYGLAKERRMGSVLNVKTAHAHYPKDFLERNLANCSAGSSMVLTSTVDGIRMNAIGYKYARSKKTQFFIASIGSVKTTAWKPYIAKFKDEF